MRSIVCIIMKYCLRYYLRFICIFMRFYLHIHEIQFAYFCIFMRYSLLIFEILFAHFLFLGVVMSLRNKHKVCVIWGL